MSLFSFSRRQKILTKWCKNPPPPPLCPSPNIVGFQLRTKTLCMCVFYTIGEGGGGWTRFPACGKRHRDIFWHKKSRHAKFQRTPSNLKNHNKTCTYASLPRSPSIDFIARTQNTVDYILELTSNHTVSMTWGRGGWGVFWSTFYGVWCGEPVERAPISGLKRHKFPTLFQIKWWNQYPVRDYKQH